MGSGISGSVPALPLPNSGILGKVLISHWPLVSELGFESTSLNSVFQLLSSVVKPQGHIPALGSLSVPPLSWLQAMYSTCLLLYFLCPSLCPLPPWPGFAIKTGAIPCFLFPDSLLQTAKFLPFLDFLLVPQTFPCQECALWHPSRACCQSTSELWCSSHF